ncbi:IncA family protein [Chlamydia crocodili]|uniref:IncA family protein n=1 Tax=Chlamydia crocodili TaxID=2766982 RepID=A0ABX8CE98_9CHLA|nr:IncA family protein [Chlamydia crocodili]QVE49333.1 IncA family protein [Chlamydia crocodili]
MKCMQTNLSSRPERQVVSTNVDRTYSHTAINALAIVSGILVITSSIAGCVFLGADLGLLSAILLSFAIISGLILIAVGTYFCCQGAAFGQVISRRVLIEQARVAELTTQLTAAQKELITLRSLQLENQEGSEQLQGDSISQEQQTLLQERSERIVNLESVIQRLRKEHADLLEEKDKECYAEMIRQTSLRTQIQNSHQQEMESKEKSVRERLQFLEDEMTKQMALHADELTTIRKTLLQNQEKFNQELQEKEQQISDLQDSLSQQRDVDLDQIHELEALVREKEESIASLQSSLEHYRDLELDSNIDSLPSALVRIRQQEERITLLETINLQLTPRTRNRSSSI